MKIRHALCALTLACSGISLAAGPATQPTTKPATQPAAGELLHGPGEKHEAMPSAKVSPEAQAELNAMRDAYSALKTLSSTGTVTGDFDVNGQVMKGTQPFASTYAAPNKFRVEAKDNVLVGSSGEKMYAFLKTGAKYAMDNAPKERVLTKALPKTIGDMLSLANPSSDPGLMLALSKDAATDLAWQASEITKAADVTVGGMVCTALQLTLSPTPIKVTLAIDPKTHLLKQATTDFKELIASRSVPDVKSALITLTYTAVTPNGDVAQDAFAWAPPDGAHDVAAAAADDGGGDEAVSKLEGKPAPDFTLDGLDGKAVTLKDNRGDVVVLDFWATWCGPCKAAMPHLNQMASDKDLLANGLKVYAVDQQESATVVKKFLEAQKYTLTALLDSKGSVGKLYGVTGIPQTVVIGRDGTIKKIFVGYGPGMEKQVRAAIEAAQKEEKPK